MSNLSVVHGLCDQCSHPAPPVLPFVIADSRLADAFDRRVGARIYYCERCAVAAGDAIRPFSFAEV